MSTYKVGSIEVIHQPTTRPSHAEPLPPSRTLLEPGHRRAGNSRPIEVPTILERDQILTMRDGVRLRADIYRPATGEAVPAIVMWGPYGKSGSGRCKPTLLLAARAATRVCTYTSVNRMDQRRPFSLSRGYCRDKAFGLREL